MTFRRSILFTSPTDEFLDSDGVEFKNRLLQKIRKAGYEPQLFFREGLPKNMS